MNQRNDQMVKRQAQHVRRQLTSEELARVNEARRLTDAGASEIRCKAKQLKAKSDAARATLQDALRRKRRHMTPHDATRRYKTFLDAKDVFCGFLQDAT